MSTVVLHRAPAGQRERIEFHDLGIIRYADAWTKQEAIFDAVVADKLVRRERGETQRNGQHQLLLCEHPPVFTLGRNGDPKHLLMNEQQLAAAGIDFHRINRGGDITYHGLGQLVGYPILDLDCFFTDIGRYLRLLEECVIRVMAEYCLKGERLPGATGVWLDPDNPFKARKICALGIRASRWVTMHGFAFNVNTDLEHFRGIVPCGIDDKAVTSLAAEVGHEIPMSAVKKSWMAAFKDCFDAELVEEDLP